MWGWMIEEDLAQKELEKKKWTGCFAVPRELFIQSVDNVVGALSSKLGLIGSAFAVGSTLCTLGMRPLAELVNLRGDLLYDHAPSALREYHRCLPHAPLACRIEALFRVYEDTRTVSLIVRHSDNLSTATRITFDCATEEVLVDRSISTHRADINTSPEVGPFTLYRIGDLDTIEPLRLTVFLDHDTVEVFANDRFVISTRVYTDAQCTGISLESVGSGQVDKLKVWDMH